jgi:hypothetical protein
MLVAGSTPFHPSHYDLSTDQPLFIGWGAYEQFHGLMSDVRLYRRALSALEITQQAQRLPDADAGSPATSPR